jgi:hypothetical protein
VSLGARLAFSVQPVLASVWRPVVLLSESGTWARRLTQSPELGCAATVLTFFIAGLLFICALSTFDNLGAYTASRPETGLLFPSVLARRFRHWPNSHWGYQSGVDGDATECGQANFSLRASKTSSHTGIRRGGGGSIELEQMVSANPPLAVHRLHGGRHHQRRYCGTGEVQQQAGPIGSGHTCLAPDHRPVFVRAAVRQQAAGIGRPRMKGNVEWDLRSAV